MSDELNDAARDLIASARRSGRALEPGRRARVRLAVLGAVGGSSLATAASMSVAKLVIVAAVSAAVGSGATLVIVRNTGLMARKNESAPPAVPRVQVPPPPVEPPPSSPPPAPVVVAPPVAVETPAPIAVAPQKTPAAPVVLKQSPRVVPEPVAQPEVTPEPEGDPETPALSPVPLAPVAPAPTSAARLAQELEMLNRALEATKTRQWAQAQQVLDEHARRFSPAALQVEARSMQVMVWCGEGRAEEARALARELERTDPLNPAVQRLRGTCAERP